MYDNCRLQLIYPGYEFRAGINYKNIEKGKPWAEGSLFCDGELNYYIVEKKEAVTECIIFTPILSGQIHITAAVRDMTYLRAI